MSERLHYLNTFRARTLVYVTNLYFVQFVPVLLLRTVFLVKMKRELSPRVLVEMYQVSATTAHFVLGRGAEAYTVETVFKL